MTGRVMTTAVPADTVPLHHPILHCHLLMNRRRQMVHHHCPARMGA
jgi:hypothetical protein